MSDNRMENIDEYYLAVNRMTNRELIEEFNKNESILKKKKGEADFSVRLKAGICRRLIIEHYNKSFHLMEKFFGNMEIDCSEDLYREAIESNPHDLHVLFNVCLRYKRRKEISQFERVLSEMENFHKSSPYTKLIHCNLLFLKKRYEECISRIYGEMEVLSKVKHTHLRSLRRIVHCYKRLEKSDMVLQSIENYNKVAGKDCSWGYRKLAEYYISEYVRNSHLKKEERLKILRQAEESIVTAIDEFGFTNGLILYIRGHIFEILGEYENALECLNRSIDYNPYFYRALMTRVDMNLHQGKKDLDVAHEDATKLIKIRPSVISFLKMCEVLEEIRKENGSSNYDDILALLSNAVQLISESEDPSLSGSDLHLIFSELTNVFSKLGNFEAARTNINEAIENYQKRKKRKMNTNVMTNYYFRRCQIHRFLNEPSMALIDLHLILETTGRVESILSTYSCQASIYCKSFKDYPKTVECYKNGVNLALEYLSEPTTNERGRKMVINSLGFCYGNMSSCYTQMKKYGKSYRSCIKAIRHAEKYEFRGNRRLKKWYGEMRKFQKHLIKTYGGVGRLLQDKGEMKNRNDVEERVDFLKKNYSWVGVVKYFAGDDVFEEEEDIGGKRILKSLSFLMLYKIGC